MIVAAIVVSELLAAALGSWLEHRAGASKTALVERLLNEERERTNDLLTRLAARNLAEYHAHTVPAPASDRTVWLTDDTGLIAVPAGGDD